MNLRKTITVNDVRNARKQADCGGHRTISIEQYTQHIDCLLAEIDRRITDEHEDTKMVGPARA